MGLTIHDVVLLLVVAFSAVAWVGVVIRIGRWALGGASAATAGAARPRVRVADGPPPDQATAVIVDGWLTLVGFVASPTDRFQLEGARPPTGHTGDVTLTIKHRDQANAAWRKVVIIPPWTATSAPIEGVPSLGAEHELTIEPAASSLVGRIVQ